MPISPSGRQSLAKADELKTTTKAIEMRAGKAEHTGGITLSGMKG
jgi:hypothetical protein